MSTFQLAPRAHSPFVFEPPRVPSLIFPRPAVALANSFQHSDVPVLQAQSQMKAQAFEHAIFDFEIMSVCFPFLESCKFVGQKRRTELRVHVVDIGTLMMFCLLAWEPVRQRRLECGDLRRV